MPLCYFYCLAQSPLQQMIRSDSHIRYQGTVPATGCLGSQTYYPGSHRLGYPES